MKCNFIKFIITKLFFTVSAFGLFLALNTNISAEERNSADMTNARNLPITLTTNLPIRVSGKISNAGAIDLNPVQRLSEQHQITKEIPGEYLLKIIYDSNKIFKLSFKPISALSFEQAGASFNLVIPGFNVIKSLQILKYDQAQNFTIAGQKVNSKHFATNIKLSNNKKYNYNYKQNNIKSINNSSNSSNLTVMENEQKLKIIWNKEIYPWLQLIHRDDSTGESKFTVISLSSINGEASFTQDELSSIPAKGQWLISLSNGINTIAYTVQR